jgi:hypothetical protein
MKPGASFVMIVAIQVPLSYWKDPPGGTARVTRVTAAREVVFDGSPTPEDHDPVTVERLYGEGPQFSDLWDQAAPSQFLHELFIQLVDLPPCQLWSNEHR